MSKDNLAYQKRRELVYNDPNDIHITDVTWGEAVQMLHEELHRIPILLD